MRAELRRIHSPDQVDLREWSLDAGDQALLMQLMVGPDDGPGEESFDVTVSSAGWLAERAAVEGRVDARHHLVIANYDYDTIEEYFRRRVATCQADTWQEVASLVGRLGKWEFEDYSE